MRTIMQVRDPFGASIYFRERTLQSATPAALLAKYRKEVTILIILVETLNLQP